LEDQSTICAPAFVWSYLAWAFYQGDELELMKPLLLEAKKLHLETENENSVMGLDNERLLNELEKRGIVLQE
jgi:hypothetical protein